MENLQEFCAPGTIIQEEYVQVNPQVSLRVIRFAPQQPTQNPVMVFVPGWISLIHGWKDVLREMTRDFTVYYVETREKISSRVSGNVPYTVEALGKDIVQIIDHYHLQDNQYILFGSSLGATVILDSCRFLRRHPRALILVGPNAVFRVPRLGMFIIRIFYPGFYPLIKPIVKWYLHNFRLNVESDYAQYVKYCRAIDAADPYKLKKAVIAFSRYQVWELLPNIPYPTLIIGASKDKLHEPENLKRITAMLPKATYLDMETNKMTHGAQVGEKVRQYLVQLEKTP